MKIACKDIIKDGLFHQTTISKTPGIQCVPLRTRALTNIQKFKIEDLAYKVTQPVTFTPYASVQSCSARCRFCSENLFLKKPGRSGQSLRPSSDYHEKLFSTLLKLKNIPMGLSLSGLEISDDPQWLLNTLRVIANWQKLGGLWTEKAAYTNASGFHGDQGLHLIDALKQIHIDRIEVSRHHHISEVNQNIMRFKDEYRIKENPEFEKSVRLMVRENLPVTLVCILQKTGINSNEKIKEYLSWCRSLGVKKVIFRELCEVPSIYRENSTFKYIQNERCEIEPFVKLWLSYGLQIKYFVNGYYFWNAVFQYDGQEIVFERSDYSAMKEKHNSDVIYKFVYFANGSLCYDWDPEKIILEAQNGH